MENMTKWLCLAIIATIAGLSAVNAVVPILAQTDNQTSMMAGNATSMGNATGNMTGNNTSGTISAHHK